MADSTTVSTQDYLSIDNSPTLEANSNGTALFYQSGSGTWPTCTGTALTPAWTYVTAVVNPSGLGGGTAGELTIRNGVQGGSLATATAIYYTGTPATWLGDNEQSGNTGRYIKGAMNEARIENVPRSANWIVLNYKNQLSAQTFITVVPGPAAPALSSPSNGATNQSLTLTLSWASSSGPAPTSYQVEIATSSSFSTASIVADDSAVTVTTQMAGSPKALQNGTLYFWRALAINAYGLSAWSATWSFSTLTPWGPPPLFSPATGAINQPLTPTLTWIAVTNAASYEVQVSTDPAFGSIVKDTAGITSISLTVPPGTSLANYSTWYWRVNSYDPNSGSDGDSPNPSAWSAAWSFTTVIAAPQLSSPLNAAGNLQLATVMSWSPVSGAASYALQVSDLLDLREHPMEPGGKLPFFLACQSCLRTDLLLGGECNRRQRRKRPLVIGLELLNRSTTTRNAGSGDAGKRLFDHTTVSESDLELGSQCCEL